MSHVWDYIDGPSAKPLVLHGPTGSGKTTLMAAAAYQLMGRSLARKRAVIVRFLGTTLHSSNIRVALKSICEQVHVTKIRSTANNTNNFLISYHSVSCTCMEAVL